MAMVPASTEAAVSIMTLSIVTSNHRKNLPNEVYDGATVLAVDTLEMPSCRKLRWPWSKISTTTIATIVGEPWMIAVARFFIATWTLSLI